MSMLPELSRWALLPHAHAIELDISDLNHGDTSMSLEWLQDHADGYALASIDRSLDDPYQPYVYLRAV